MRHASRLAALARAISARGLPELEGWRVVVYDPADGPPDVDFGENVDAVLYLPDNGRDLPPADGERS